MVDGYHFDVDYQRQIRNAGFKLLAVDDYGHCDLWCADAILNQNIYAPDYTYESEVPGCQLMLGTKFALLRRDFIESKKASDTEPPPTADEDELPESSNPLLRSSDRKPHRIERLLLTLGGSDPDNVTGSVLELVEQVDHPQLEIRVLVGSANPHREDLAAQAQRSRHQVQILTDVRDMPAQYLWADGVISAAGSTCWEWLYYRLPAAVVVIADNQRRVAESLRQQKLTVDLACCSPKGGATSLRSLNEFLSGASPEIESCKPTSCVDTHGPARVVDALRSRNANANANTFRKDPHVPG